jgi:tRNA (guanine37-N1)-methyltransferase
MIQKALATDLVSSKSLLSLRFDLIGDVAIVSLPPHLESDAEDVVKAILSRRKGIKTVLRKVSKAGGDNRVPGFEWLAGGDTVTTHKENGYYYRLDVARVFFNPRLSYERRRVASLVEPGEAVFMPFAGAGPFCIPVADRGAWVVAVEKSWEACLWLAENSRLNKVDDRIDVISGDALQAPRSIRSEFDRAVIPAPYGVEGLLKLLSPLVRRGGWIHLYTFKKRHQIEGLIREYEDLGFQVEFYRRCGNVAPSVSRWVFDLVKL